MKQTIKTGLLSCVVFLVLLGFFAGFAVLNNRDNTQPTQPQVQTTNPTNPTDPANPTNPTEPTVPTEPEPTVPEPDFTMSASHVFVYDTVSQKMLYTKGSTDEKIPPASLTKLFTAYVGLQYLQPDAVITAGEEVTWIDPESSRAFIAYGHQITVEQCVEGMILQSGNDAAYILAVAAGRAIAGQPKMDARAAWSVFIGKMNETALMLGLTNTHFANPDGIDADGHYTSLTDLAQISRLAMENPIICKYASTAVDEVTYVSGYTILWKNTNELLHPNSKYYCADAVGLKTGSTTNAGKCLISAFKTENGYLIVGVLGCPDEANRYQDTLNLYHHYTGK